MEFLSVLLGEIILGFLLQLLKILIALPLIYIATLVKWLIRGRKNAFSAVLKEDGNWIWGICILSPIVGLIVCIC